MADAPPPPPPAASGPRPPGMRPPTVTAAGVILIVVGGLSILLTLIALPTIRQAVELAGDVLPGWFFPVVILGLILAAVEILAGILVLRGVPGGRILGIVVASISAVLLLLNIGGSQTIFAVIAIALRVLVIIWLAQNRAAFERA